MPGMQKGTQQLVIEDQGDRTLIIRFGDHIDPEIGQRCLSVAEALRQASLPGVIDIVPSYTAIAIQYKPTSLADSPTFASLSESIRRLVQQIPANTVIASREVEIPVCYGGVHGPDLEEVARHCGLTPQQVIDLHTAPGNMVYMLGFAPGHPYIGLLDARLSVPRKDVPRTAVAPGSVATANRQTSIYPNVLPGGWSILGATPLKLFDVDRQPSPALLQPGDRVRFVAISETEFDQLREAQA